MDLMTFIERSNQQFGISRKINSANFTDYDEELLERAKEIQEEENGTALKNGD